MIDEGVAEIRAIRHKISEEFGHDIHDYIAYLRTQDEQYAEQVSLGHSSLLTKQEQRESQKRRVREAA